MADSTLERIKELDKEREQLMANARKEALAKAKEWRSPHSTRFGSTTR